MANNQELESTGQLRDFENRLRSELADQMLRFADTFDTYSIPDFIPKNHVRPWQLGYRAALRKAEQAIRHGIQ